MRAADDHVFENIRFAVCYLFLVLGTGEKPHSFPLTSSLLITQKSAMSILGWLSQSIENVPALVDAGLLFLFPKANCVFFIRVLHQHVTSGSRRDCVDVPDMVVHLMKLDPTNIYGLAMLGHLSRPQRFVETLFAVGAGTTALAALTTSNLPSKERLLAIAILCRLLVGQSEHCFKLL